MGGSSCTPGRVVGVGISRCFRMFLLKNKSFFLSWPCLYSESEKSYEELSQDTGAHTQKARNTLGWEGLSQVHQNRPQVVTALLQSFQLKTTKHLR